MDGIKNNWGFIAISFVCLVIAIFLVLKCSASMKELRTSQDNYEKNVSYLDGVGKKKIKLSPENIALAEKNQANTTKQIQAVRKEIMDRFTIKYDVPKNATLAVQELKARIGKMQEQLENANIELDVRAELFSFDAIYKSVKLPPPDDIGPIFRQLTIVSQIVNVAEACKVSGIKTINRPMDLLIQEEADYTITPIEVTINGSAEQCQDFVNAMSSQENYLFFLRTVEIAAPDITTEIVSDLKTVVDGSSSNLMINSSGRADMGERRTGGRRASRMVRQEEDVPRRSRRSARSERMERQGRTGRAERAERDTRSEKEEDGLVEIPMRRQELLAFENKVTAWNLRFDLIEPKYAVAEKTEDAE